MAYGCNRCSSVGMIFTAPSTRSGQPGVVICVSRKLHCRAASRNELAQTVTTHAIASLRCMIDSNSIVPGWPLPSPEPAGSGYFMPWRSCEGKVGMTQGKRADMTPES